MTEKTHGICLSIHIGLRHCGGREKVEREWGEPSPAGSCGALGLEGPCGSIDECLSSDGKGLHYPIYYALASSYTYYLVHVGTLGDVLSLF